MDNQITVNMENLTQNERKTLLELVASANKQKVWKPKLHEKIWLIMCSGKLDSYIWTNGSYENDCYAIGNCFKSQEEAEFAVEKLKVIAELKRFAEEHNEGEFDWNDPHIYKYCIDYGYDSKQLMIWEFSYVKYTCIIFTSRKIAEQAIEAIGADRLKKYYFEVEE